MSYPDPQPPQPFMTTPYFRSDSSGFWQKPFVIGGNEQQASSQFGYSQLRSSEKPINMTPMSSRINPPGGRGTSHIFFKTRLCAQFRDGNCRNGDHCTFAHGNHDLRHPPPNWQDLVREKDREAGNGNWGDDQIMIQRLKMCKKYFNGEECPYGEKCNFLHERPSQTKKPRIDTVEQRESSVISIGLTGNGNGDFDQTAFWKTKICSKWEMGICPYGERCSFAHGPSDLRSSSVPYEAEPAINTSLVPRKHTTFPILSTASANVPTNAPVDEDEQRRTLRWKLKKKINRIYADWIDNSSPPACSPATE